MMKLKMLMMIRPSLPSCTEIMCYYIETLQMFFALGKHFNVFYFAVVVYLFVIHIACEIISLALHCTMESDHSIVLPAL